MKEEGLKIKYNVFRISDGSVVNDCFVLQPEKDPAAVEALYAYAMATQNEALTADILVWMHRITKNRKCKVCGCTDDRACPGGCYWVTNNLCSVCAEATKQYGASASDLCCTPDEHKDFKGLTDDILWQEIFSLREKLKIAVEAIKFYDPEFDTQEFMHRLNSVDYEQLMEELSAESAEQED